MTQKGGVAEPGLRAVDAAGGRLKTGGGWR